MIAELPRQSVPTATDCVSGGTGAPVIVVAWSLQFEVLFYLSFCAMLLHVGFGLALYAAWAALSVSQAVEVARVIDAVRRSIEAAGETQEVRS